MNDNNCRKRNNHFSRDNYCEADKYLNIAIIVLLNLARSILCVITGILGQCI